MRLLRPNPGEAVDRQTILRLKMEFGESKNLHTLHFQQEHEELQKYLHETFFVMMCRDVQKPYDDLYAELYDVNNFLWQQEDNIRSYIIKHSGVAASELPHDDLVAIATIGLAIAQLNDKRAQLVMNINKLFGVTSVEKLHAEAHQS
jgi:hypothetical protein